MLLYFIFINIILNIIFIGIIIYFLKKFSSKINNYLSHCHNPLTHNPLTHNPLTYNESNLSKGTNENEESNLSKGIKKNKESNLSKETNENEESNLSKGIKKNKESKESKEKKSKEKKLDYNKKKCFNCIENNLEKNMITDCPHCGSENYDTGCIPPIVKEGKPNNCIPKELSLEQAYRACKSASNSIQSCNLIHQNNMLEYQKKECKREDGDHDYYCVYDESDSCSYNICDINDYYSYGPQSICDCQKVPNELLGEGKGRECKKNKNCEEYHPLIKAPALFTDPKLKKFYDGYSTWMDVPNITNWYSELISENQIA